jgi:hypothetical protein
MQPITMGNDVASKSRCSAVSSTLGCCRHQPSSCQTLQVCGGAPTTSPIGLPHRPRLLLLPLEFPPGTTKKRVVARLRMKPRTLICCLCGDASHDHSTPARICSGITVYEPQSGQYSYHTVMWEGFDPAFGLYGGPG